MTMAEPTWEELMALEPRLADLLKLAESYPKESPGFCANAVWYGPHGYGAKGLKDALVDLIGWDRHKEDPLSPLRSEEAYDVAYDYLYASLPDCQHKGNC